ncbi:MAG TPA: NUDIX hydrolase [Polyangiaceae bacterium]|nr:NUDIX hydrolase [Polyangiaceae bacterium]
MIPRGAFVLVKEVARHLLRRPVVGVAIAGRDARGRWLLVRRADTGEWALPGGTLEWGETLPACLARELAEEANATLRGTPALRGVYSAPWRDPRFHGVTVLVSCEVEASAPQAKNPLEIREARFFTDDELPAKLAFGMEDMLRAVQRGEAPVLE